MIKCINDKMFGISTREELKDILEKEDEYEYIFNG